jgi:glucose dehydrogenase
MTLVLNGFSFSVVRFGSIAAVFFFFFLGLGSVAGAQEPYNPAGEWRYWGGGPWTTRYSPLDEINADNFEDLEVAWLWRGDNFGSRPDYVIRSTPLYVNGKLFTVAGSRRTVVAIDASTGETLWTFREPHTLRYDRSERYNYGKGVAYAEVDGRGVIYLTTPGFFLHALDAETGQPLEGFGGRVPIDGFPETGSVDMLAHLGHPYDTHEGIDRRVGNITTSSPPIVVNGVVVVGNSSSRGRYNTRIENVPGDILGYDARTGENLWKFKTIPGPGEVGHETWENDAWEWTGNVNAWPPLSADPELGLVYIPTDAPTNDYFGGFRPGDNLFANSIVALDVQTGERVWHFQTVHHDVWDWDQPVAPNLVDVTVDGRRVKALVQTTKQAFAYVLDRETGVPVWPIPERPVPQSEVPGEKLSPTQPHPTLPAGYDLQGMTEDDLIDFTPELRQMALDIVSEFQLGPVFTPPLPADNAAGLRGSVTCPGSGGGTNIPGGAAVDPETGIMYVASVKGCSGRAMVPGSERDDPESIFTFGETVSGYSAGGGGLGTVEGLPIFKPPYGRITAIDLNTGETLWWIPNGDTPERIRNHPRLRGMELPNTGQASHATVLVTESLLMYGEGRGSEPRFHAVDKRTGQELVTVELPAPSSTAPMTFLHEGRQYIVVPIASRDLPGSLVALRLP